MTEQTEHQQGESLPAAEQMYCCPDQNRGEDTVLGCGQVFLAEADDEGLVDCPCCGIWFDPELEPDTVINLPQESFEQLKGLQDRAEQAGVQARRDAESGQYYACPSSLNLIHYDAQRHQSPVTALHDSLHAALLTGVDRWPLGKDSLSAAERQGERRLSVLVDQAEDAGITCRQGADSQFYARLTDHAQAQIEQQDPQHCTDELGPYTTLETALNTALAEWPAPPETPPAPGSREAVKTAVKSAIGAYLFREVGSDGTSDAAGVSNQEQVSGHSAALLALVVSSLSLEQFTLLKAEVPS